MTEITEAEFFERFKPTKPIEGDEEDDGSPVSDIPEGTDPALVWTCCDAEDDQIVISGIHFVNAWGYYIATVPVPAGEEYYYMNLRPTEEDDTGYDVDDEDDLRLTMVFDQAWKSDDDDGARKVLEYYTASDDAAKEIIDMVMIKLCGWSVPTLVEMAGKLPQDD